MPQALHVLKAYESKSYESSDSDEKQHRQDDESEDDDPKGQGVVPEVEESKRQGRGRGRGKRANNSGARCHKMEVGRRRGLGDGFSITCHTIHLSDAPGKGQRLRHRTLFFAQKNPA